MIEYVVIFLLVIVLLITVFVNLKESSPETMSCSPGECITNYFTGERDCTELEKEGYWWICTPRGSCNNIAPYLIHDPKQGTINSRICPLENPEECKCMRYRLCPDYVTTYFRSVSINNFGSPVGDVPFESVQSFLVMENSSVINGVPTINPPLSPDNNGVCHLSYESLKRAWPKNMIENNQCLSGNLVYDRVINKFYCTDTPAITCFAPNRIIKRGENFTCEKWV